MPSEFRPLWPLDPAVEFMNHGTFGATPVAVLDAQAAIRQRMEREPVAFFSRDLEGLLDEARVALGAFVGADPDDLAFVDNATTAVNAVLRWLPLGAGDELLTTDHEYNACRNVLAAAAAPAGARVVTVPLPFPALGPEDVLQRVLAEVTPRTRLAVLDHVTSATALAFPIEELVAELSTRGVDTLVDGAHAPGMLDVQLDRLGAAYYAGNLHKWVCAPKGAAFVHVRRDRQDRFHPLVVSHGANSERTDRSRFRLEADWTGTRDPSAWLATPVAIELIGSLLPGGWPAVRLRNRDLALRGRDLLCTALAITAPAPDAMIGSMASVPLPDESAAGRVQGVDLYGDPVHDGLLARGFQVMVTPWPQRPDGGPWRRLVRISAALHNDLDQYQRLASALLDVLTEKPTSSRS
ncbi:MAG TPA: aminotransferase class V-fold PLP-dependent enzyme [Candidatus Limnocylindria bacterium]|nr:aminotransferase class V-fold PLP-dependent enzyme [Candidatus Limnocylindria bacterium]